MISRLTTQEWLEVGEDWHEGEDKSSHSALSYEYRVMCDEHYYGRGCANLCRPRNDNFGHYTCSPTGDRVCLDGWQGDYCTKGNKRNILLYLVTAKNTSLLLHNVINKFH